MRTDKTASGDATVTPASSAAAPAVSHGSVAGSSPSTASSGPSRSHKKKRHSLTFRGRVALSFAVVTVVTSVLFVVVLSFVWNGQFSAYTRDNMEEIASSAATSLAREYDLRSYWDVSELQSVLTVTNLFDGVGIQVLNSSGVPIYDNTWILDSSISLAPDASSMVSEPIMSERGMRVGTVNVWAMGSDVLLTAKDLSFRQNSLYGIFVAAVIALVIAVGMGFACSRILARPVRRIMASAQLIKEGDLAARTGITGPDDIGQLGETFDDMARVLERDRELEKRLTADVAHELRTPLMAMQATVEAMQDGVYPTDAEHLETVAAETRRLARLVQQTLDLSRLENHTAPLRLDKVDIVQLAQNIVNNQHQLFHNKGLHLRFVNEMQGRSAVITCDADMITQCIINLMSNAMRYTPEDGWVVVSIHGDRKHVMVTVSDTGIGIAKDDLARIFGRFWRADASRAREAGGLGVGLAVTKQIVERHHGFIAVESELEKGTTFTIHLPRELEEEASSTTMKY